MVGFDETLAGLIGFLAFMQPFASGEVTLEEGVISVVVVPMKGITFDVRFNEKFKQQMRRTHSDQEIEAKEQAVREELNGGAPDVVYLKSKKQFLDEVLSVEPYLWGFLIIPLTLFLCGCWGLLRSFSRELGLLVFVLGGLQCSGWFITLFVQQQLMKKTPHVELVTLNGSRWFLLCGCIGVLAGLSAWFRSDKS